MPALKCRDFETHPGVLVLPREWSGREVSSHSRVVLTESCLLLVSGKDSGRVEIAQDSIRRAKLDLVANSLEVEVVSLAENAGGHSVQFASQAAADQCFTSLWRCLGDQVRLVPCKRDFWALARLPTLVLVLVLAVTVLLAMAAHGVEQMAEARAAGVPASPRMARLEFILGGVCWEVICGLGGALAALVQVWLYRRVTEPPPVLEIVRA